MFASYLSTIVATYGRVVKQLETVPTDLYYRPFVLDDMIDNYVEYVNLLSAALLLHREDQIPRIYAHIEGTNYDGSDAIIERMLGFFLPGRSRVGNCYWKAYTPLLAAILLCSSAFCSV